MSDDGRDHRGNVLRKIGYQAPVTLHRTERVYVRSLRVLGIVHRPMTGSDGPRTACGGKMIGGEIIAADLAAEWVMQPCSWCFPLVRANRYLQARALQARGHLPHATS